MVLSLGDFRSKMPAMFLSDPSLKRLTPILSFFHPPCFDGDGDSCYRPSVVTVTPPTFRHCPPVVNQPFVTLPLCGDKRKILSPQFSLAGFFHKNSYSNITLTFRNSEFQYTSTGTLEVRNIKIWLKIWYFSNFVHCLLMRFS